MAVDVLTTIEIERPAADVAAFAGDPDNAPRWYRNIQAVEWKTAKDVAVGARIGFVAQFLGRRLVYTYEIVEQDAAHLVMRTAEGPFPMETTYLWESLGPARTRMSLRNRGQPEGFSALLAPFMSSAMRKANQQDLADLKRLLES